MVKRTDQRVDMDNLKERRLKLGLTQAQLARLCRCSPAYISDFERGRRNAPEMLAKILAVLDGKRVPQERTAEEKERHELWCERYGD